MLLLKESKELLEKNLQILLEDLNNLHQKGVDINMRYAKISSMLLIVRRIMKHFCVDAFLCCDYSFTCKWLGLSPSGDHFCYLCTVNRKMPQMVAFEENSPPRGPLETWIVGKFGVQV